MSMKSWPILYGKLPCKLGHGDSNLTNSYNQPCDCSTRHFTLYRVFFMHIAQFLNLTQYTKLDSIQWTPGNNTQSLPSRTDDHWLETKGIPRQLDRCLPSSEICENSKTRYKTMCFKQKLMPKCVSRKFFYILNCEHLQELLTDQVG